MLCAFRKELRRCGSLDEFEAGPTVEEAPPERERQEQYWDESRGAALKPEKVEEARARWRSSTCTR
eukprot:8977332-Heterocapsa_arctica.AAC.1